MALIQTEPSYYKINSLSVTHEDDFRELNENEDYLTVVVYETEDFDSETLLELWEGTKQPEDYDALVFMI
jgi:hypothetical protein